MIKLFLPLVLLFISLTCFGVTPEEVKEFRKAAEQGVAKAQFNLGLMYYNGEGVPEDYVVAYMWWNIAAAQGNEDAKSNKGIISEEMTKEQIAEAQKLSREWMAKHSE